MVIYLLHCKISLMSITVENVETFCRFYAKHNIAFRREEYLFASKDSVSITIEISKDELIDDKLPGSHTEVLI